MAVGSRSPPVPKCFYKYIELRKYISNISLALTLMFPSSEMEKFSGSLNLVDSRSITIPSKSSTATFFRNNSKSGTLMTKVSDETKREKSAPDIMFNFSKASVKTSY